jgi:hypothetical protein
MLIRPPVERFGSNSKYAPSNYSLGQPHQGTSSQYFQQDDQVNLNAAADASRWGPKPKQQRQGTPFASSSQAGPSRQSKGKHVQELSSGEDDDIVNSDQERGKGRNDNHIQTGNTKRLANQYEQKGGSSNRARNMQDRKGKSKLQDDELRPLKHQPVSKNSASNMFSMPYRAIFYGNAPYSAHNRTAVAKEIVFRPQSKEIIINGLEPRVFDTGIHSMRLEDVELFIVSSTALEESS